ncbi:MAG: hypothetical protein BWY85_00205 [Firmicutes bacterium ADurb.Bin506]|nr:MAG: hypothetical protein BWY85_00205 [Firmicutes bacterium ADurb.Bin506]
MTLPALTWRQSAVYGGAVAGAPAWLAAIHSMLAAEEALGGAWAVSHYDALNGTLEMKLASPADLDQAKIRILIFGGQLPHANALETHVAADAASLYVYLSLDADTTGPSASYATGDPYPSSVLKSKGMVWVGTLNSHPIQQMYIYDCAEALIVRLCSSTNATVTMTVGRLLDDGTANGRWCRFLTNGRVGGASSGDAPSPSATISLWMIPALFDSPSYSNGVYIDETGGGTFWVGRVFTDISMNYAFMSTDLGGIFSSVTMGKHLLGGSGTWSYAGVLRQMRYGPTLPDRTKVYSGAVLAGYAMACLQAGSIPLYLDQTP